MGHPMAAENAEPLSRGFGLAILIVVGDGNAPAGSRRYGGKGLRRELNVIEEGHEAVIHVQLLVAVEQRGAWVVGYELDFGFLVAA